MKKVWMYLYRAVDSEGTSLEFLLSPMRDAEAANRFFCKALYVTASSASHVCSFEEQGLQPTAPINPNITVRIPRVINVDKNAASPKAIADLKAAGILPDHVELRQMKYLNNVIEQDHRFIKRLTKPGMGFFSFETASRTLHGYEIMNMFRKGQVQNIRKGDIGGQVTFIASLFGMVA